MQYISYAIQILTLGALVFAIYKYFRDPDEKASQSIALLSQGCQLKHANIDKDITEIKDSVRFIKNNHINHMERDINEMKNAQVRILTILEERDKK